MYPCMKLRHLEEIVESVDDFEKPKILLEQYRTPAHLASHMLFKIQSEYGDIQGKLVADLGCGCGALTVGAAALDALNVIGFEIDEDALEIFTQNTENYECENIEAVQLNVLDDISDRWNKIFDTVIMNPPFGTKHNQGIDMKFLDVAFRLANTAVYSLHKTSTRKHVMKVATEYGVKPEILAQLHYNLPATYRFHKKSSVDIEVDFYRFEILK